VRWLMCSAIQGIVAADTAEVTDEEGFFNPSRSVRPMHYNMSCHVMSCTRTGIRTFALADTYSMHTPMVKSV
jgi:hypothetical protein